MKINIILILPYESLQTLLPIFFFFYIIKQLFIFYFRNLICMYNKTSIIYADYYSNCLKRDCRIILNYMQDSINTYRKKTSLRYDTITSVRITITEV